ncbi:MAG: serine hydrolase [Steroidobacteraceae bacterium]
MLWRSFTYALPGAGLALLLAAPAAHCGGALPPVRDDARVQAVLEDARARFLDDARFDRLDVTVLLAAADGAWLRGSVGGRSSWYPASCVKLGYAAAAVHWCEAQGRKVDCLDSHVAPMLEVSDNVETGFVVDAITGAPNGPADEAAYPAWFARRLYTENLLAEHGLLDGQKFINKTYPTNSGEEPAGLEALARERHGRNAMHADGAANLMLAVVSGEFGKAGGEYIRKRLRRPRVSKHSSMGGGFPEGTVYESKIGDAYDTLAQIVHAELPDGRRLIVAAFSNGRDPDGPEEQDLTALAGFSKLLLERLPMPDD